MPSDARRRGGVGRGTLRRRIVVGAIAGGLLLLSIAVAVALAGDDGGATRGPGPLVAALAETDWRFPADPETGYRRLTTPFRDATFDRVAVNEEGMVAWGMRMGGRPWVIAWRGGEWRAHSFLGHEAVTALGVDPEGVVHAGFSDGTLARITPDGTVETDGALGSSVIGFAFDAKTPRSALMVSGGEVRTGLRPLRRSRLHTVRMPERARIRAMVYSADGELVVAGDAGALFVATDDGWEEGSLPTSGNVSALGVRGDGDILVTQSNGHVFAGSGVTWDRVGQVSGAPVAVGWTQDRDVLVALPNGRIHATLGGDDFSEMPGWQAPPSFVASDAVVAGDNVIFAGSDRVVAWDGQRFDGAESAAPEGTVTTEGCRPVMAGSGEGVPGSLFDCGGGVHATLGEGTLEAIEAIALGDGTVAAADLVRGVRDGQRRGAVWMGSRLLAGTPAGHPPAIHRLDVASGRWEPIATLDPDAGDVLSLSAAHVEGGFELWTATQSGTVFHATVSTDADAPEFAPVVDHARFQEGYGEAFHPASMRVHALGSGRALVLHDGWIATRVAAGVEPPGDVELLSLFTEPPPRVRDHLEKGRVLFVEPHRIRVVAAEGPPVDWTVPPGLDLAVRAYSPATLDFAVRGGDVLLRATDGRVARCRDARCDVVRLPAWVSAAGVLWSRDGRVVVAEPDGVVGIVEPRE